MKLTLGLALVAVAVTSTAAATDDDKCSFGCLDVYKPVCGSNGETYSNSCYLRLASCQSNNEITEASDGECASTPASSATASPKSSTDNSAPADCPDACPDVYNPVTDENGKEYSNECNMKIAKCEGTSYNRNDNPGVSTLNAQRKLAFAPGYTGPPCADMLCPDNYNPVCGSDGVTYTNECSLGITSCNERRNITLVSEGACPLQEHQQEQQQQQQQEQQQVQQQHQQEQQS